LFKKNIRRVVLLLACIPWVRKLSVFWKKRSTIRLNELTNFEYACNENLRLIAGIEGAGLIYMGRFGGVRHQFLCTNRKEFFKYLKTIRHAALIRYNKSSLLSQYVHAFRLKHNYRSYGYVDLYKEFVNKNDIIIFGQRESVRIYFPKKIDGLYFLPKVNPVLRSFDYEEELVSEVEISGFSFKTFHRFLMYLKHDPLKNKKIDLVYTWVDGFDEKWKKKKAKYDENVNADEIHESAVSENRFYHINELLYSIRSALTYTNFIRKIYIVTDQQIPEWFQCQELIEIIDHKDIFPKLDVLPTFNSHSIETCLHHIEGLSKYYLYLNDDFLFGRSTTLSNYFTEKFYPKINYSNYAFIPEGNATNDDLPVDSAAKNARDFFLKKKNTWITRKFKHVPCPVNMKYIIKLEKEMNDLVETTREARFRTFRDISFVNCAYYHWMRILGKYQTGSIGYSYFNINEIYESIRLYMRLSNGPDKRWEVFCLNDVDGELNDRSRKISKKALDLHFCEPSSAETAASHFVAGK